MKPLDSFRYHEAEQNTPEVSKPPEFSFGKAWSQFAEMVRRKKEEGMEFLASLLRSSEGAPEQRDLSSEAREVAAFFDAAIDRVEAEAEREVASLLGTGLEAMESLGPSQLKRLAWYNLPSTPDGLMREVERTALEKSVDVRRIESRSRPWATYLSEKVRDNDVVLLGEAHTVEMIEKNALLSYLETAKTEGVTHVGFEVERRFQEAFDRYLETGKFLETDDPSEYEASAEYMALRLDWNARHDAEALDAMGNFKKISADNFVGAMSMHEYYPMLKRMRELGLKAACIDGDQNYSQNEIDQALDAGTFSEWKREKDSDRDARMYESVRSVVAGGDKKMIVIVGAAHVARNGRPHRNAGDLLASDPSVRVVRITMDRNFDKDVTVQEDKARLGGDVNLNSVLYTALERQGILTIGIDLDDSVLSSSADQTDGFPFDGYIKL